MSIFEKFLQVSSIDIFEKYHSSHIWVGKEGCRKKGDISRTHILFQPTNFINFDGKDTLYKLSFQNLFRDNSLTPL